MNTTILNRLAALRSRMREAGVDLYMMPTADYHHSEYVNDFFKVREYFSGFTGSNGTLLVWQEGAGLWTDGRYFIQAARELEGTGIELFRMQEEGVPTIEEFLAGKLEEGQTLGFDGRVISAAEGKRYEKALDSKRIQFSYKHDLGGDVWEGRPDFPQGPVKALPAEIAGRSVQEKLELVRQSLQKEGAGALFLNKLDDIMWLFNIRGCDVECNPVAMSYAYVTLTEAVVFLQKQALSIETETYLATKGILLKEYGAVEEFVAGQSASVWVDVRYCGYGQYKLLKEKCRIVEKNNPTELLKAVKDETELANMEKVYLADSVALTRFIYWVKHTVGKEELTEVTASEHLERLRRQIPEFLDLSFPTIAGYKANAAMMHYEATPESCSRLEAEGLFLVDSGGQYLGGTTDVTRTIVLGPVSDEIKRDYTLVAAGMLQLTNVKWLYGCTGRNLDIMARAPLWDMGIDYKCGTGHGVGYILNVHEGPQNIRWRYTQDMTEAVIEAGMDVSNEPGVYVDGSYGIRIENIMVAKNGLKNEYGQFMHFDTLTWVPVDLEAIDAAYLNSQQKEYLNAYHRQVWDKVSPYLEGDEREWLREATREI